MTTVKTEEKDHMGSPPNEEIAALADELTEVESQLRRSNSGAAPSATPQRGPNRRDLEKRKHEIEDRLVQLRRENDQALGADLVDEDLSDVAEPSEPGR